MNIRVLTLLMLCAINGYSQVKKKTIYKDGITQLMIYEYDTINGGKSYEMLGKDLRYQYVIDFDTYYKGDNIVSFMNKVITFVESAEPDTHKVIDGTIVTAYPNYIQLQKKGIVGYRVFSKKKFKKIRDKCLDTTKQ